MAPLHDVYFAAPLRHQDLEPFRQWRSDQTTAISERSIRQADPAVRQQLLAGALRDNDTRLLAALIPHTQPDPAEITAWMETNDDHAVASAVALTPSIAHGVFAAASDKVKDRLLAAGYARVVSSQQIDTIVAWLERRWPAGRFALPSGKVDPDLVVNLSDIAANGLEQRTIPTAHWLTTCRLAIAVWRSDSLWEQAAGSLSEAPPADEAQAAELAAFAAWVDQYCEGGAALTWAAVAKAALGQITIAAVDNAAEMIANGDVAGALVAMGEHTRNKPRKLRLPVGAALTRQLAARHLDATVEEAIVAVALDQDHTYLAGTFTRLIATMDTGKAARLIAAFLAGGQNVNQHPFDNIPDRLLEQLVWTTPAGQRNWCYLTTLVRQRPHTAAATRDRIERALGDTAEYHALATHWEGSIEQLVHAVRTARH